MQPTIARNANLLFVSIGVLFWCILASGILVSTVSAQTNIGATICAAGSTVTLTTPVSDSVVTSPTVPLSGTVTQAGQIEVYINNVFDGVIPLNMGDTTYSGSVQLASGTHTIKVVAISDCPGVNGSASSVVTYAPPPQTTPSTGGNTPTQISGGVVISTDKTKLPGEDKRDLLPEILTVPVEKTLDWLNITNVVDTAETKGLSIWRAVMLGAGMYLLIVGMAGIAIQWVVSLPPIAGLMTPMGTVGRHRIVSWGFRILGLLIVGLALLL